MLGVMVCDPRYRTAWHASLTQTETRFENTALNSDTDCRWYWRRSTRTKASPLYYATLRAVGGLVEYLLITRRQDPNKGHGNQDTPLRAAIISGHTEVARLLLEHTTDLDVNVRERNRISGLHEAANSVENSTA